MTQYETEDDSGDGDEFEHPDHETVVAPAVFTVLTVIPYTDEPEYREYEVSSDELPMFLQDMDNPQIAEQVVTVDRGNGDE